VRRLLQFLGTPLGRGLRYAFSSGLVVWLITSVDWGELGVLQGGVSWAPVCVGLLLAGIVYPLHALRWWLLYRAGGVTLSLSWAHAVTWVGQFYNSVLLGGLGGDAARAWYLLRDAPGHQAAGLLSLLLDRSLGLVMLLVMAGVALLACLQQVTASPELRVLGLVVAAGLAASALFFIWAWRTAPSRWPRWISTSLGPRAFASCTALHAAARAAGRVLAGAAGMSAAIWLLDFAAVWLFAHGLGLGLPFLETCLAVAVAYAATALPVSVGGHGVREGTLLAVLAAFGLVALDGSSRDAALALGVLVWASTMLFSLAGGFVLLLARPRPRGADFRG
jgi:uncharacterized membrane protein YbhN (UPF0104 family)